MNKLLKDRISIGLSLDISLDEYDELLDNYKDYIDSIYFSPPFGDGFHSRREIAIDFKNKENIKKFYKILELMIDNEIKLDCVFNRPTISNRDVKYGLERIKEFPISHITCLDRHIDYVNDTFPKTKKIYSFNNSFIINDLEKIDNRFDTIVVGREFLRRPDLLKKIYYYGFGIKLLVNNGCSFNCGGCKNYTTDQCLNKFKINIEKYGPNYVYALQSIYPSELNYILNNIKVPIESIKISNRTSNYRYLVDCLDSYIDVSDTNKYISIGKNAYRLWGRSSGFNDVIKDLDNEEIIKIKKNMKKKVRF